MLQWAKSFTVLWFFIAVPCSVAATISLDTSQTSLLVRQTEGLQEYSLFGKQSVSLVDSFNIIPKVAKKVFT